MSQETSQLPPKPRILELEILNRKYTQWKWQQVDAGGCDQPDVRTGHKNLPSPIINKLFHGDRYNLADGAVEFCSLFRTLESIPGVLILEGNRTYGRQSNEILMGAATVGGVKRKILPSVSQRLYYRCVPNDHRLPAFLIPYTPNTDVNKTLTNTFVLFRYDSWKHSVAPYGYLVETIGLVNDLAAYTRYIRIIRGMDFHNSKWFTDDMRRILLLSPVSSASPASPGVSHSLSKPGPQANPPVFSIDGKGSRDLDDAFSFESWIDQEKGREYAEVTVYIADVVSVINTIEAWDAIRVGRIGAATQYFPHRNYPMLPSWIADKAGSLLQGQRRQVVGLTWYFSRDLAQPSNQKSKWKLDKTNHFRTTVTITSNLWYEDERGGEYTQAGWSIYWKLFAFTRHLERCEITGAFDSGFPNILASIGPTLAVSGTGTGTDAGAETEIADSRELVAYWMSKYNTAVGGVLAGPMIGRGIFRTAVSLPVTSQGADTGSDVVELSPTSQKEAIKFLRYFKKVRGEYRLWIRANDTGFAEKNIWHAVEVLGIPYAHASSPLRRMVDLYNQLRLLVGLGLEILIPIDSDVKNPVLNELDISKQAFLKHMESEFTVADVNRQGRLSKRMQSECEMLQKLENTVGRDGSILLYGTVVDIDCSVRDNGSGYSTSIFLEDWKQLVFIDVESDLAASLRIGLQVQCQIWLFEEEDSAWRKVVARIVTPL